MQKASPWGFIGMGALACLLFLDLAGLLISPWWVAAALVLVWLVLFVRGCQWFEPEPTKVAWAAAGGFVLWILAQVIGGLWVR